VTAPALSRHELEEPIRQRIGAKQGRHLIAVHGRSEGGGDDVLDIDGTRVRVVPVRSELDLRRRLLDVAGDEYAVFLIPWRAATLPLDLCGRFKGNGKIETIGREERLKARFDVTEVDDEARDCPLAEYVLAHHPSEAFAITGGRLTLDALWAAWLARVWSLDAGGELALDALLGWAAVDGRGPQLVAAVRAALIAYLEKKLGPAAPLVWGAWEAGQGATTLELALVLGALAGSTDRGVQMWIKLTSRQIFATEVDEPALTRLGETADAALRFLSRPGRGDAAAVRALVLAADQRVALPELAVHVAGSSRLPSAWRARLEQLGRALSEVAAAPSAAAVQAAVAASREVWRHDMARDPDQGPLLRRAEMALRLASWLAVRSDRELPPAVTPYDEVENLANWYVREGGYLDRARRWAHGGGEGPFAEGVRAVVAAVDAVREELDRRFARALPDWHRAGRRATQVVPIDQAVQRIATSFLDEDPGRRLLVVLMDGMAWAQAVEILEAMGNRASVWGPLAWHGMAKHRVGEGPYPAVLANFPTVTEVSRSAFFGGKAIPPGGATDAGKDPDRWRAHRDVQKHVAGNAVPQLRLRGDGQTRDGSASPDALELVLDPQQRIAAVVINAIDMSLKADRAHEVEWNLETIKALRDLLDKATEAGRAVLLCSDHGHVPSDRMEKTGVPMREGARWRVWQSASDKLAEYEVGLPAGEGVWAPRGAHGVVVIADDAHRYGGGTGSGEHGGASLAEVVAPCVLIGCADVPAAVDDKGQAVRPAVAPSWWFFDVGEVGAAEATVEDRPKRPKRGGKRSPEAQEFLPTFTPPAAPAPVAPPPPVVDSPLASSELFMARASEPRARQQALRAVDFLRARKGVASAAAFASELGEFVARVGGVVAKLQEILNVDGYQVLRFDRQGQQVILDLEKLAQQFDVSL
jgi:PglZ domain